MFYVISTIKPSLSIYEDFKKDNIIPKQEPKYCNYYQPFYLQSYFNIFR